ncbi:hypothetical protein ACTXO6_14715, partial [Corynebacterium variabile]
DTVWSQINRHLTTLTRSEARRLGPVIDTAVAAALTDWMEANCPSAWRLSPWSSRRLSHLSLPVWSRRPNWLSRTPNG